MTLRLSRSEPGLRDAKKSSREVAKGTCCGRRFSALVSKSENDLTWTLKV